MQKILRALFMRCGHGKGNVSPNTVAGSASPNTAAVNSQKLKQVPQVSDFDLDRCFNVGCASVRLATDKLMSIIKKKNEYESTAKRFDLFTIWDRQIGDCLLNNLSMHYPTHKFITKDTENFDKRTADCLTKEPTWFIDPIDGATNFIHGFPYAAVALALWINKQPQFGIVWNPFLEQCFMARRDLGSGMNMQLQRVSDCCDLSEALVMYDLGVDPRIPHDNQIKNLTNLVGGAHGLRSLGSTPLNMCMVANGYADAYYGFGCHACDATLIVQEAGGVVLDPSLKPFDVMSRSVLCASTPQLAEALSSKLTPCDYNQLDKSTESVEEETIQCQILPCQLRHRTQPRRNSIQQSSHRSLNKNLNLEGNRLASSGLAFPCPACYRGHPTLKSSATKEPESNSDDSTLPGQGFK